MRGGAAPALGASVSPPQAPAGARRHGRLSNAERKIELCSRSARPHPRLSPAPVGGMRHVCMVDDIIAARPAVAGGARVLGDGEPPLGARQADAVPASEDFCGTLIELEQV
jgi:hypothetical protein